MKTNGLTRLLLINLIILGGCKTGSDRSDIKEGYDRINDPGIFDAKSYPYEKLKQAAFLKGMLETKPWTDNYWPLMHAGMAVRWINPVMKFNLDADPTQADFDAVVSKKISNAMADAKSAFGKSANETSMISPAEKIDVALARKDMPFVRSELMAFATNTKEYQDINWGWMGNCHGWAPAAYMEKAPLNGVIFKNADGQEVFFTPGDIRGVFTKAAADNGYDGSELFIGSRCNDSADKIPRDKQHRIIDATLGVHAPGEYFSTSTTVKIQLNGWNGADTLNDSNLGVVGWIGPRYTTSPLIWISASSNVDAQKGIYGVRIYSTKTENGKLLRDQILIGKSQDEIGTFVDANGKSISVNGTVKKDAAAAKAIWKKATAYSPAAMKTVTSNLAFKYWKECRDANPGSFHLVLASLLSKGGIGSKPARSFVMDITRDDQVWNHPVYQYSSWMGAPTELKINGSEDPLASWRAKGTKKIVDVYTRVEFGVENGPMITYAPSDERTRAMMLRYTLELDDKGIVIGGEWHPTTVGEASIPTPLAGKALLDDLKKMAASRSLWTHLAHPDFIWSPTHKSPINNGAMIPAKLVKKLSECSQQPATETFTLMTQSIPAVKCSF